MTEPRSPRVGDEVEVRIPRARVTAARSAYLDLRLLHEVAVTIPVGYCTVVSSPPQPGERIETVERLAECVDGTVFAPDAQNLAVAVKTGHGWYFANSYGPAVEQLDCLPGVVLAIRGEQR
jgi:hypothetical protein